MRAPHVIGLLTALASTTSCAPTSDQSNLLKRQCTLILNVAHLNFTQADRFLVGDGGGKVKDPSGPVAPRRADMISRLTFVPGSKAVKIRYGPYSVVDMMTKNSKGEPGMLNNYPDRNVEKPCKSCKIIGLTVGLEYANGTTANTDSLAWLHHVRIP
jgi:hypothetical protein